jgi:hypothetical protein
MSWRNYQDGVADFFRQLGCQADVDFVVEGVRASHRIDVWVRFQRYGLNHHWAVECKKWTTPVPKEKVLALKALVDDVGADLGLLVSDSGFQPGAVAAARASNIVLTSLADLQENAEHELLLATLDALDRQATSLEIRLRRLFVWTHRGPGGAWGTWKTGVDPDEHRKLLLQASMAGDAIRHARVGQFPVMAGFDEATDRPIAARDLRQLVELAGRGLTQVDVRLKLQEQAAEAASSDRSSDT